MYASVPTAAWVCALLAFTNAAAWSLITPPFQVSDEPDHFAYVQQIAETRSLPRSEVGEYSPEERAALNDVHQQAIQLSPETHAISSRAEQRTLENDLARHLGRRGPGGAGTATSEPPLYYALQTIPYEIGSGGTILERLELMRLLSAIMAAFTALFVFLFIREAVPAVPWAWTVGGLGVALAPLLGFISGGVNPDAMLFAVSAALFFGLARAFRRGLTRRLAMAIGAVIAIGFMTKLNFLGLAPGAVLGLILLGRRAARKSGWEFYYSSLLPAVLIAFSPILVYVFVNIVLGHRAIGPASGGVDELVDGHASILHEFSYIWQFYLPRLPRMHDYFGGIFTTRQIWFNGLIGLYGWADTVFPAWVYNLALIPVGLIVILCARELTVGRVEMGRRVAELVTYAVMGLGVLIIVGVSGYPEASTQPATFAEPRYILPMLALWGAVLALAARGAGRRWGPVVGALIVVLVLTHDIFSQLQVIARYYG
jgi:4-amino-4-deoxy-L-arabinose transferase-like glycosyltransferase